MTYSCGYWKDARSLDEAQEHKFELICRKLYLQPGQRILDIGCGFGDALDYFGKVFKNYEKCNSRLFFTTPIKPSVFCFAPSWTQLDWGLEGY
jgi:hypothetical protein